MKIVRALFIVWFFGVAGFSTWAQPTAEIFDKLEVVLPQETKPAKLHLDADSLLVETTDGSVAKRLPYAVIKEMSYSYSKRPRYASGTAVAMSGVLAMGSLGILAASPLLPVAAIVGGIKLARTKSKKHWLTIQSGDNYAVLRLDKRNQKLILLALKVRTGLPIQQAGEQR